MKIPYCAYILTSVFPILSHAQITTSTLTGRITNSRGDYLSGAGITIRHLASQTSYFAKTRSNGFYSMDNLQAGGPYQIDITCPNHDTGRLTDWYIGLAETIIQDFVLKEKTAVLSEVTVRSLYPARQTGITGGNRSVLDQPLFEKLPAPGFQLSDYLRVVPNARLRRGEEGAVSFGGQNNRYNSFYVDGAIQNDVFGLSGSGTNGGQAGISPISFESIEQMQVTLSPYDVSIGNFTGAGIQAVTKSGSNQWKGSVYQYLSAANWSDHISGENPDIEGNQYLTRKTGIQLQGAIRPNRLFYYFNAELERNTYPKKFSADQYTGYSFDSRLLNILSNTLKNTYHYDPGTLWDKKDIINADRLAIRIDWNAGAKSKYTFSYRYALGDRMYTNQNDSRHLHFSNDGYHLNSLTSTYTAEWKTVGRFNGANRLLLTYTKITDDRDPGGNPFPGVRIYDGEGVIQLGTDMSSGINYLAQRNMTLFDKYSFWAGKHLIHLGTDGEFNQVHNAFIQNSFGNYSYSSLSNFLTQAPPSGYQLGIPLLDSLFTDRTKSAAAFSKLKISFFLGDQFRPSAKVSLQFGVRIDYHRLLQSPAANTYVNDSLLPVLKKYYDIEDTRSGVTPRIPLSVSPRISVLYAIPLKGILLEGGVGVFAGRIPLVWPGGTYLHNGLITGEYAATPATLRQIRFKPDPYHQWMLSGTGSEVSKIPLDLLRSTLALPKRLSGSFRIEKKWHSGWKAEIHVSYSKTWRELKYTNINLLPPVDSVSGPDNRWVYTSVNGGRIPVRQDGYNPFGYVILIGNQKGHQGYAKTFSTVISRMDTKGWQLLCQYSWGRSMGLQDGSSSVNSSQWRFVESVNGRNQPALSESDYSPGHHLFVLLSKDMKTRFEKNGFRISISYTGSSGPLFSYVYGGQSMTRDDGIFGAYDLIYVPDYSSLDKMIFLPIREPGENYAAQEQRDAFRQYLERTPYLRKKRGQYAERNGSRSPFTHRADFSIQQKFRLQIGRHRFYGWLSLDVYNILNLINRNWGRVYEVPFDAYPLLDFAGYAGNSSLLPQYRFHPKKLTETPWRIAGSNHPLYSSFWVIRLGTKINF